MAKIKTKQELAIYEKILPIPAGYQLIGIKKNTMLLKKKRKKTTTRRRRKK